MARILTQRAVEGAKPKAKRYGRADGLVSSQQFIVHPSGEKSYAIFPRIHGKQVKITIGDATVLSLAEARTKGKRILAEIADGKDPRATKRDANRVASETLEVVARRFIERHAKARNKSWKETERLIEREILSRWGKRPITSIARQDIVALLDAIIDRGSPIMANRTLAALRKLFNWSIERSIIENSPCDRVKAPAGEVKRDRVHTDAELALIWQASATLGYPFASLLRLAIMTGQRREEVAAMRWSEFDPEFTLWTLPRERAKNNNQHQVPIVPAVRAILTSLPRIEGSDLVFTTTGRTPVSGHSRAKASLDATVANLNGAAAIPPWVLHDLRRTMASGMARLGVQLPVVEKLLNHISGSFGGIAGVYQRYDFGDEKRQALERWAEHIASIASGSGTNSVVSMQLRGVDLARRQPDEV